MRPSICVVFRICAIVLYSGVSSSKKPIEARQDSGSGKPSGEEFGFSSGAGCGEIKAFFEEAALRKPIVKQLFDNCFCLTIYREVCICPTLRTCKEIIFHFWLAVASAGGVSKTRPTTSRPAFYFLAGLVLAHPKTKPDLFTSPN